MKIIWSFHPLDCESTTDSTYRLPDPHHGWGCSPGDFPRIKIFIFQGGKIYSASLTFYPPCAPKGSHSITGTQAVKRIVVKIKKENQELNLKNANQVSQWSQRDLQDKLLGESHRADGMSSAFSENTTFSRSSREVK